MDKIKELLIAHGEKLLAAFCVLFAFLALSSAEWKPNAENPEMVKQKAARAEKSIDNNDWPPEEQAAFKDIDDVRKLTAVESKNKINPGDYAIVDFKPQMRPAREKRTRVDLVAAVDPVADYVIFPLAMPPEEETEVEDADEDEEEKKDDEDSESSSEFDALLAAKYGKKKAATVGGPGGMAGGLAGGYGEGGYGGDPGDGYSGGSGEPGYGSGAGGLSGGGLAGGGLAGGGLAGGGLAGAGGYGAGEGGGGYGEGGYGGGYGSDLTGAYGPQMMVKEKRIRVSAGVSVRLVVDIQKQRALLRDALRLGSSVQEAQQYIQYTDIQVERRQRREAIEPWSEWEEVSSEDLGSILEDSLGIDMDVVAPAVTRNTITMPLPRRATGNWPASQVSHPRIEDFELGEHEKEVIDRLNAMMAKKAAEAKQNRPVTVKQRGFANFSQSATDMNMGMPGIGMPGMGLGDDDYNALASGLGEKDGKLNAEDKALIDKTLATAENRLLLVRFMDFTVDRGHEYGYRVRLVMKNPNFEHRLDELEDPSLATEPELTSPWSPVSAAIRVPVAYRLYVDKVDSQPGRPESVAVKVFTDTTESGLPLFGVVKSEVSLPIAEKRLMKVVDLRKETLSDEEVVLETEAILADAESVGRINRADHPELSGVMRRLASGRSLVPDQITLVQSDGSLAMQRDGEKNRQLQMDQKEYEYTLNEYSAWDRDEEASGGGGFFGPGDPGEGEGGMGQGNGPGMGAGSAASGSYFGGGKKKSSRARRRESRKKGKGAGGMGPAGGGYGAGGYGG